MGIDVTRTPKEIQQDIKDGKATEKEARDQLVAAKQTPRWESLKARLDEEKEISNGR